ncbi:MAG: ABC transporter permease [Pseudorhodoplanes sp.]
MGSVKRVSSIVLQRCLLFGLIAVVWWAAARNLPSFVLPGPAKVFGAIGDLIQSASFRHDVGATASRVVSGFLLAAVSGTVVGLVLGSNRILATFFEPILAILNTVSSAIWAIFAIIWFGISDATTVFVVFMTAFPLILTNVWQGTLAVERQYVDLARAFRMSQTQILLKIFLPSILPYFFSGARLAFGFGWRVSLVAETLGASDGIGYRLRQAADLVQSDRVFAWTLLLVALMLILEAGLLKPLERALFRWKTSVQ